MINIATENYPEGQMFEHPWKFWVIDNFLHSGIYTKLLRLKDTKRYEAVDTSNGVRVTAINAIASKEHIRIRRNKTFNRLYNLLENNCFESLSKIFDTREILNWKEDTNYVFDLVKCDPKYAYPIHVDHNDKKMSIVVYLHPNNADGTILLDQNKNEYNVVWKPNRALIFITSPQALHRYYNTTTDNRYSLNVYVVEGRWEFCVGAKD